MPTYQYRCQTCSHEFEEKQSFADDALTDCPVNKCKGSVKKVFSGVGISFKGEGFYKNDHGSASKKLGSSSTENTSKEKTVKTTDKSSTEASNKSSNTKSSSDSSTSADSGSK
ncbi:MAG TPA: FmdB family zinc ribbon protein [Acidimicrobiales bacterium]|nr:FmdB family zinc ribbon protein [Acidimicrobiales bacterium]